MNLSFEFPKKITEVLLNDFTSRYIVLFGGRGAGKSHSIARAILIRALKNKIRVLCGREMQNSIKDSVHKLLKDIILAHGLTDLFNVLQDRITCVNGSEIFFAGLKNNIASIKSFEGVDLVWLEEASSLSRESIRVLFPTIRKEGSQIIISFNPELESDPVYEDFITNQRPNSQVIKVNWSDNPWFPKELEEERLYLKRKNESEYNWVWEGSCRQFTDGAIFIKQMQEAELEARITNVPYDKSASVSISLDLGYSDLTSAWVFQLVGFEYRLIRFYQANQMSVQEWARQISSWNYRIDTLYLPHDADHKTMAAGGQSIAKQFRAQFLSSAIKVLPNTAKEAQISHARDIFNRCYFDKEHCADGLTCLRRYRYDLDSEGMFSRKPLHDIYSHGADSFLYFALSRKPEKAKEEKIATFRPRAHAGVDAWMAR